MKHLIFSNTRWSASRVARIAFALLPIILTALLVAFFGERKACVWPPLDPKEIVPTATDWWNSYSGGETLEKCGLRASGKVLSIDFWGASNKHTVEIVLGTNCSAEARVVPANDNHPAFSRASLADISVRLRNRAVTMRTGKSPQPDPETARLVIGKVRNLGPLEYVFLGLAGLLVIFCSMRRDGHLPLTGPLKQVLGRPESLFFVVASFVLLVLSAWPVFGIPFTMDSQILRWGFAATDPAGDWNHPFLSYLLNSPVARFTHEPAAVRIIPFVWVIVEAAVFSLLAARLAGLGAASFVMVWMAISIRSTMGMNDLGDWNLAGIFLGGMCLWIWHARQSISGRFYLWWPAVLVFLGCSSSHLMIAPAAVFTVIVFFVLRRTAGGLRGAVACGVVMALELIVVFLVFREGSANTARDHHVDLSQFLKDLVLTEPPLGLSPAMLLFAPWGFVAWGLRPDKKIWIFSLSAVLASLAALIVALLASSMHGAYYFGLMKGPVYVAAGVGIAAVIRYLAKNLPSKQHDPGRTAAAIRVGLSAIAAVSTFSILPVPRFADVDGVEKLQSFVEYMGRREIPVYSLEYTGKTLIDFQDIIDGRQSASILNNPSRPTWARNFVRDVGTDGSGCDDLPEHSLAIWVKRAGLRNYGVPPCDKFKQLNCIEILLEPGELPCMESTRKYCFFDCRKNPGNDVGQTNPVTASEPPSQPILQP